MTSASSSCSPLRSCDPQLGRGGRRHHPRRSPPAAGRAGRSRAGTPEPAGVRGDRSRCASSPPTGQLRGRPRPAGARPVCRPRSASPRRARRTTSPSPGFPGATAPADQVAAGRGLATSHPSGRAPDRAGRGPARARAVEAQHVAVAVRGQLGRGAGGYPRPRSTITTRSASSSASSSRWVVSRIVTPSARAARQQVPDQVPGLRIQAGGRLVQEQQLRPADQRHRQAEPLHLAAGEPAHRRSSHRGQAQHVQQPAGIERVRPRTGRPGRASRRSGPTHARRRTAA